MPEQQITGFPVRAAPNSRVTKDSEMFELLAVNATFDGSAAGTDFLPAVEIVSDAGVVVARHVTGETVAAGGSAEVTFAPFLRKASSTTPAGDGLQFHAGTYGAFNIGDQLDVETTSGGMHLAETGHGSITVGVNDGGLTLTEGGGGIIVTENNGGIVIQELGAGGIVVNSNGGSTTINEDRDVTINAGRFLEVFGTSAVILKVGTGATFTVADSLGNPKLQWTEGTLDLHIPTGGVVVADL